MSYQLLEAENIQLTLKPVSAICFYWSKASVSLLFSSSQESQGKLPGTVP